MMEFEITSPLQIRENQWYEHPDNGMQVCVRDVANLYATNPEELPLTVVYQDQNGAVWAEPAESFLREFDFVGLEPTFSEEGDDLPGEHDYKD